MLDYSIYSVKKKQLLVTHPSSHPPPNERLRMEGGRMSKQKLVLENLQGKRTNILFGNYSSLHSKELQHINWGYINTLIKCRAWFIEVASLMLAFTEDLCLETRKPVHQLFSGRIRGFVGSCGALLSVVCACACGHEHVGAPKNTTD